ncbi:hypothetical protein MHBO_000007 [Bonamia ostreae]|uniref:Uncharacterized protein n=1 Tax=Bonamia ostreae TaxID=126728 RepID=A0ABV2AEQ2_9EUKA
MSSFQRASKTMGGSTNFTIVQFVENGPKPIFLNNLLKMLNTQSAIYVPKIHFFPNSKSKEKFELISKNVVIDILCNSVVALEARHGIFTPDGSREAYLNSIKAAHQLSVHAKDIFDEAKLALQKKQKTIGQEEQDLVESELAVCGVKRVKTRKFQPSSHLYYKKYRGLAIVKDVVQNIKIFSNRDHKLLIESDRDALMICLSQLKDNASVIDHRYFISELSSVIDGHKEMTCIHSVIETFRSLAEFLQSGKAINVIISCLSFCCCASLLNHGFKCY